MGGLNVNAMQSVCAFECEFGGAHSFRVCACVSNQQFIYDGLMCVPLLVFVKFSLCFSSTYN